MARARLNRVLLIGNLTRDPELRYTPSGTAVADLGLAINDDYAKPDGSRVERTCFVDVTVWGRTAETSCEYLSKGRQVLIEGRLRMDTWETNDGQKRSRLRVTAERVQFLGGPRGGRGEAPDEGAGRPRRAAAGSRPAPGGAPEPAPEAAPESSRPPAPEAPPAPEEDDIPF